MPATNLTPAQQLAAINSAAGTYHIPIGILAGVYAIETSSGANITTSSAGAMGAFQFIPGTAASYGYPMTNTPNQAQFQQQANSAAHYLSDLYHQHGGSWEAALQGYSGGGYGLSRVQQAAGGSINYVNTQNLHQTDPLSRVIPNVGLPDPLAVAKILAKIVDALFSGAFWLKALELIGGAILVFMGIRWLGESGGSENPTKTRHIPVPV